MLLDLGMLSVLVPNPNRLVPIWDFATDLWYE